MSEIVEIVEIDCLVVGSGPAGQKAAIQAAKLHKSVVVIEAWEIGGSSLWNATIPSKALRKAILDFTGFSMKSFYADRSKLPSRHHISIRDLNYRVNIVKTHLKDTIDRHLKKNNIKVVHGLAKFIDPYHVAVFQGEKCTHKYKPSVIILATGSKPRNPPTINFDGKRIFNSTQLLDLDIIPKSMIVVGAGVIGTEYASMFSVLGTNVTLVDKREMMLSFLDQEVVTHLKQSLEKEGLKFIGGKDYDKICTKGDKVTIEFTDGGKIGADIALIAAGRTANVDGLEIGNAGLSLNARGYIEIDSEYRTKVPHIYAAGDITGGHCLASTGYVEGRLAALYAFHQRVKRSEHTFPFGIYSIPEVASVGKTEEQLKAENVPYEVGRAHYYEISKCVISGEEVGLLKIIFNKENSLLLGAHIVGIGATETIHLAQVTISNNWTIEYLLEHVFNFPAYAEAYHVAALNGINKLKKG